MTGTVDGRSRVSVLRDYLKHWLATPLGVTAGYVSAILLGVFLYHTYARSWIPDLPGNQQALLGDIVLVVASTVVVYGLSRHTHTRLRAATDRLGRQSDLITVLLRALRHNLRNRITVIRGHLDAVATGEDDAAENVTRMQGAIDKLLTLSEQARQLESIVAAEADTRDIDITATVREIASQVESEYPRADITVEQTDTIAVRARPTLTYAVRELVTNAVKHGGDAPSVSVSISRAYRNGQRGLDGVQLAVTDTGPGLPENERQVLHEGAEEPLVHGSGLGLYQVYLVVDRHGGSIDTTVTEAGTRVVVSLPNARQGIPGDVPNTAGRGHGQFKAAFEQSPEAMAIVDDTSRICTSNDRFATMVGLPRNRLVGHRLNTFIAPGTEPAEWWQAIGGTPSTHSTAALVDTDGREQPVACRVTKNITAGKHLVVFGPTGTDPDGPSTGLG